MCSYIWENNKISFDLDLSLLPYCYSLPNHVAEVDTVSYLKHKIFPRDDPFPPEILARTDLPPTDSSESWHLLPCSASTVRDRNRSPITLNKLDTSFPTSHQTWFYTAPNFLKIGIGINSDKVPKFVVFCTISTMKHESLLHSFIIWKLWAESCSAINYLSSGINILAGAAPFPWYLNAKGTTPIGSACTLPHSLIARKPPTSVISLHSAHWLASDFHSWINSWIDCQTNVYTIWLSIQQFNQLSNQQLDRLFVQLSDPYSNRVNTLLR